MRNTDFREAISETLDILAHMDESYTNKIPENFKNFLEKNKTTNYISTLDFSKKLNELNLKEMTKDVLAVIYMNYWCDVEQRKNYISLLNENEIKYQEELREKYNPDNIFKNNIVSEVEENKKETVQMIEYQKTTILKKFLDSVKEIFHLR